jgi:hypothetical protein
MASLHTSYSFDFVKPHDTLRFGGGGGVADVSPFP